MKTKRWFIIKGILFVVYTGTLAVLVTRYINPGSIYLANYYILPIVTAAYYFNIWGGILSALFASISVYVFFYLNNIPCYSYEIFTRSLLFFCVGIMGGILQRQNLKYQEFLYKLSIIDPLTNLYNYGHFKMRYSEETIRATRYNRPIGLIMIDIDFFKSYNDRYGHQMGNEVLRRIAQILKNNVRPGDLVFRYGGEEFAVILPEIDLESVEIAEKLRKAVEAERFPPGREGVQLTISCGVAFRQPGEELQDLEKKADNALYEAKRKGRNRIVVAKPAF